MKPVPDSPSNEPLPAGSDLPEGLSRPAQRGLAGAGITRLEQLTTMRESEITRLHGIGPNALALLRQALEERGLAYASDSEA